MAKSRSPNRDKAFEIFKEHNGEIKNRKIAEILQEPEKTISSWKSRERWVDKLNESNCSTAKENDCSTAKKKRSTSKKLSAALKGNQNAVGNPGNRNPKYGNKNAIGHGAPAGNDNAVTHGFFRKHFPEDVADLAAEIMEKNPIDMLWENITIQYTAIIRAQRLMYVVDQEDMTKELKKTKESYSDSGSSSEEEWEIQFAWDKHATFLNAQSRAMSTLSSLIRDFDKLANIDDERRAKLNLINAQIDKLKADINKEDGEVLKVQIIDDVPLDDDNE
ncbi:phage terminase small subunit [Bacillus sp. FSL R5-0677]|uniref:phage terminase small subunit n=1 Tax=Bacillus sp. FSL R5-0677 TaxID=2921581 RepID=UPI0030FBA00F